MTNDRFAQLEMAPDGHLPCTIDESTAVTKGPHTHVTLLEVKDAEGAVWSQERGPFLRCLRSQKGVLLILLSTIFFTLQAVVVSYLKNDLTSTVIVAIQLWLIFSIVFPLMVLWGIPIVGPKDNLKFLIVRSFVGSMNLALKYFAFQNMRIGDATAIFFATPAFTGIFARIILKEPFNKLEMVVVALSIIGVLIVSQPPFLFPKGQDEKVQNTPAGIASAVSAMLLTSLAFVLIRKMGKRNIRPLQTIMYFSVIGGVLLSTFNTVSGNWVLPACGSTRYILLGFGGLGFCTQVLVTYVLTLEKAVVVSVARSNEVFLTFLFEFLIFSVVPSLLSCIGSLLIVSSILLLLWKKTIRDRGRPPGGGIPARTR